MTPNRIISDKFNSLKSQICCINKGMPSSNDIIFVSEKSDFPTPSNGVITLLDNATYFITSTVDLIGDRLACGINTTIIGGSSENCRIKSTGLTSALITSSYSLPIRNITITVTLALSNFSNISFCTF